MTGGPDLAARPSRAAGAPLRALGAGLGWTGALAVTVVLAVSFGAAHFPLAAAVEALVHRGAARDAAFVLWELRMPRVLLALMIGAQLAASGMVLQAALRNPLAEPGVIGVSSGATLGIMVLLLVANFAGSFDSSRLEAYDATWMPLAAQLGGVGAALAVHALAWRNGTAPLRLVLMGVAVSAALYAVAMTILAGWGSSRIEVLLTWLSGNLYARGWRHVAVLAPWTAAALALLPAILPRVQVLALGDDAAASVGLDVERWRFAAIAYAGFAAASAVAIAGPVAFVGLIAPHLGRLAAGGPLARQAPAVLLAGALITALADLAGRVAIAPAEIPVGAVTALLGAPLFLYLLSRSPR
ncbi:iron ABC transporter permease [Trinickia terrae]|uniref:Iron ABC transporter permease n=1 Tax=Trinickia terrae TaxID=2571161 RepID=A0A4U1I8M0_9BURK|nr:iron ABC transporter permease [Trinickia terrae]TKC89717.1 iron ABC transporter permease [Trinickia terrae]